ncbi:hypothetical protein BKA93DRAFT_240249 [Sparassis latifolia]
MSVRPEESPSAVPRRKVTIQHLHKLCHAGAPITMLTAYNFPTVRACYAVVVHISLVGDSLDQAASASLPSLLTLVIHERPPRRVRRGPRSCTPPPLRLAHRPLASTRAARRTDGCSCGTTSWGGHQAKFDRRFANFRGAIEGGVKGYLQAVRDCSFPSRMRAMSWGRES